MKTIYTIIICSYEHFYHIVFYHLIHTTDNRGFILLHQNECWIIYY